MKLIKKSLACCTLILACIAGTSGADELKRRADIQTRFKAMPTSGVEIVKFRQNSTLEARGLKIGDHILAINGQTITGQTMWNDTYDSFVANSNYLVTVKRDNRVFELQVSFKPLAKESYPDIEVTYGSIVSDYGIKQRYILSKPAKATGKLPSVFVVGGLSCSSLESTPGRSSNYIRVLRDLVTKSNMLVFRLEKPGLGDSEGNCSQTDFKTELNGLESGLQWLKAQPFVDPNKIIVYGNSMGSAIAPYLANKYSLNGVIADGTFYRSWFEHMLEIERRIKSMQGVSQADINTQINHAYIPLYYGMLIDKKSYADLIQANPLLGKYNYHGAQHMYGRPMSYYHQVQDFNFAGEWSKLKVPARIRWGSNDWIMSEADNHMLVEALKTAGNDDVELFIYPGLDHWSTIHKSASDSFNFKQGKWEDKISQQIVDWAKHLNK